MPVDPTANAIEKCATSASQVFILSVSTHVLRYIMLGCSKRSNDRALLCAMNDDELCDIGLCRGQIIEELPEGLLSTW